MEPPQAASENRTPGRRGATPTPLPAEYGEILVGYAAALEAAPLRQTPAARTSPGSASTWPGCTATPASAGSGVTRLPSRVRATGRSATTAGTCYTRPTPSARSATATTPWPPSTTSTRDAGSARLTSPVTISPGPHPGRLTPTPRSGGCAPYVSGPRSAIAPSPSPPSTRDCASAMPSHWTSTTYGCRPARASWSFTARAARSARYRSTRSFAACCRTGSMPAADGLRPAGSGRCSSTAAAAGCPGAVRAISSPPSPQTRAWTTRPQPTLAGTLS